MGGDLWCGQAEAAEVVRLAVEHADANGRLRGILEAVRSNRVEDDFSEHWSYAREDFERKLYRKRAKIKVRFVELTDTIPVQGPETEIEDNLVFADFLALLDERERQVVLLLRSGITKVGDVASALGYKNHSPVSKRLAVIRKKAAGYFGDL
jgi:DNA-directed RNA polymerase specialized sigma24 family protein